MSGYITDDYAVSGQIAPEALKQVAEMGFTDVICNRPDAENPPELQHEAMRRAAEAVGLSFHYLPLDGSTLFEPEHRAAQAALLEGAKGKVFAYCASGNRCTVIWALGQIGKRSADEIIHAAGDAGYNVEQLRPLLSEQ